MSNLIRREDSGTGTDWGNQFYRDGLDRIYWVNHFIGSSYGKKVEYEYNKLGQVTEFRRYENLAATTLTATSKSIYDDAHRLWAIEHRNSQNSLIRKYIYGYDAGCHWLCQCTSQ